MFSLIARFHLKNEEAAEGFDELVSQLVPRITEREPRALVYVCHRVGGDPLERIFYELYADRAAFDAHERQPHMLHFFKECEQYLTGREVDFLTPTVSKGVDG